MAVLPKLNKYGTFAFISYKQHIKNGFLFIGTNHRLRIAHGIVMGIPNMLCYEKSFHCVCLLPLFWFELFLSIIYSPPIRTFALIVPVRINECSIFENFNKIAKLLYKLFLAIVLSNLWITTVVSSYKSNLAA